MKALKRKGGRPVKKSFVTPDVLPQEDYDRPLRIGLLDINTRLENRLRYFFSENCHGDYVVNENPHSADICLIDLDGLHGKSIWASQIERQYRCPTILLSLHETQAEGAIWLQKPLQAKLLYEALEKIRRQFLQDHHQYREVNSVTLPKPSAKTDLTFNHLHQELQLRAKALQGRLEKEKIRRTELRTRKGIELTNNLPPADTPSRQMSIESLGNEVVEIFIGSTPDVDLYNKAQLAQVQYDPQHFLIGRVLEAVKLAETYCRPASISSHHGTITIVPMTREVLIEIEEQQLHSLASQPIETDKCLPSLQDSVCDMPGRTRRRPIEAFVWELTLWSSLGRMPAGTNPHQAVRLKHWPNLTRLQIFPHATRITALWSQQKHSLATTAQVLNIPQRYVFAFYSAAHAIGLAATEADMNTETGIPTLAIKSYGKPTLFKRILHQLKSR
ncbi:MAG: hypothetical protein HPY30_16780 [Gammaproteobacteria bacterium (ex Lamellibrachia satsuma)]|nr:MAG: hypothetical protein HPY30_16780 [Gammaproteobacteria bacterium (ex Lamellibrachia satsuma)]